MRLRSAVLVLGSLDYAEGERMMAVNAFGPFPVSEAFYQNVKNGDQKKIVAITLLTPGEVAVEKVKDPGPEFIAPAVSIRGMIGVIDRLTLQDSGAIIRYNGKRYALRAAAAAALARAPDRGQASSGSTRDHDPFDLRSVALC